jgi:oxygen-dependent protoporphyrinogen oxidase
MLIIGGGISGLSAAYYLSKAGIPSTIIEKRPRLGGVINTERVQGCLIEGGPDSYLSVKPWASELITELGMGSQIIGSNDSLRKTYILKSGRMAPIPDGLQFLIPTKIAPMITTPLLGWGTKIRMGLEVFRKPPASPRADTSVADFVREHYGQEVVDYLAEPLLAGVYGGSPETLSVQSVLPRFVELETRYGSLSKGTLAGMKANRSKSSSGPSTTPLFRTLRGGLGDLVSALEKQIAPHATVLRGAAELLERTASGFRVRVNGEWMESPHVILACEAHQAAPLLRGIEARAADLLSQVAYSSSLTMALAFRPGSFRRPLDGFGFLIPRKERKLLSACTFVGTKFTDRTPEDLMLLRCFAGGIDGEPLLARTDEQLIAATLDELRTLMGLASEPVFTRISRWPRSMAQYTVGHAQRTAEVEQRLQNISGLFVAGNAYHGIGIPDCVRMGKQAAQRIIGT